MNARIIKHFEKDEATGELHGDYSYVTVEIYGRKVKDYGDYYHEKGFERAQAFIEGYACANNIKAIAITYSDEEINHGTV